MEKLLAAWNQDKCRLEHEAGSYLRFIDSCITLLKAQGPTRTCNESKEEEEEEHAHCKLEGSLGLGFGVWAVGRV